MEATEAEDSRTIGRRVREVRAWRRMTQKAVADLAGISEGYLSKIEHGQCPVERRSLIVALANALDIAPSELTKLPVPAPGNGHADSATEEVRRALIAVDLGHPGGEVFPVEELRGRVTRLQEARRRCRFADVASDLPGLIRDLHTSLDAGRDVADLLTLAAVLHVHLTYMWLQDAGAPVDLRREAAALARKVAQEHGEGTTLGVAAFGTAWGLLVSGMPDLAQRELDAVTLPTTTPETADLVCGLTMMHAVVAAADDRPGDVAAPMDAAAELPERFGKADVHAPFGFAVGPADVGFRRVALALEAGEPDRAVAIAESVRPAQLSFVTRQAGYWMDYGRGLARLRGRREDAVRALCTAEHLFPTRLYRDPFARDTVADLLGRSRRDAGGRELRRLAYRMGLAG